MILTFQLCLLTSDPKEPLEPVELSLLLRPIYTRSALGAEQMYILILSLETYISYRLFSRQILEDFLYIFLQHD